MMNQTKIRQNPIDSYIEFREAELTAKCRAAALNSMMVLFIRKKNKNTIDDDD